MRKITATGIVAAVLSSCVTAAAADMALKAPAAPLYARFPTWAGFYIGATVGWSQGAADGFYQGEGEEEGDGDPPPPPPPPQPPPPPPIFIYSYGLGFDNVNLGGYAGYNLQFGQWVISVEGDLAWIANGYDIFWDPAGSLRYDKVKLNWLAHARGRLGFAIGSFLPYFSAGAAFADVYASHLGPVTGGLNEWSVKNTRTGYSLGGGIVYQLTPNWLFRAEYLYDHFDTKYYDWVGGTRYSYSNLTVNTVRVGITFRPWY